MRKLILSLFTVVALGAASLAFAQGTVLSPNGIGQDCAKVRGAAIVDGAPGALATGPGWLEIKGRRYEGTFIVIAEPDQNAPRVDPQTGVVQLNSFGFEAYVFEDGKMFARDTAIWTMRPETPGRFEIYGTTLSGPAFNQFPDYPAWGTGVFANALLSLNFRGTLVTGATVHGEYTVEDGTICNVDWKAIK
jgi:hypothetical protein